MKRVISAIVVAIMLVFVLAGCNKDADKSLKIQVEDIEKTKDGQQVILSVENETGGKVSFGWVSSCEILVTAGGRTKSYDPPGEKIGRGDSEVILNLPNCTGKIEKIVITDLRQLDDRGLPDARFDEAVIYDRDEGIDSFEDSFPALQLGDIIPIAALVLMGVAALAIIIAFICTNRKNKKAMEQFSPYGAPVYQPDMGHQMHMQAHQQQMQMHQQAYQQAHQQAVQHHNDFSMQSVMPMDQGGFAPPPPPPPPGM